MDTMATWLKLTPLNAKLNPICHLLVLLEAHPILHISRKRVNQDFRDTPAISGKNTLI
jgi:hypothetical protein